MNRRAPGEFQKKKESIVERLRRGKKQKERGSKKLHKIRADTMKSERELGNE